MLTSPFYSSERDLPFLRFRASKLGEGQVLFLLALETVDPGTGIVMEILFSPQTNSSAGKNHLSWKSVHLLWKLSGDLIRINLMWIPPDKSSCTVPAYDESDVRCLLCQFHRFYFFSRLFLSSCLLFLSNSHFTWCGGTLYLLFRLYTRYNKTMYLTTRGACQVFPRLCHIQMSDPKLLHG